MSSYAYSEDTLVQQTTAEYLQQQLGWDSIFAYYREGFGLGMLMNQEVVV